MTDLLSFRNLPRGMRPSHRDGGRHRRAVKPGSQGCRFNQPSRLGARSGYQM